MSMIAVSPLSLMQARFFDRYAKMQKDGSPAVEEDENDQTKELQITDIDEE